MSTQRPPVVRVGVQAVVSRGHAILLGQRKNSFGEGTWGLPGGHLEIGETLLEAAARELREETGIQVNQARLFCVTDPTPESNHHMQIGVEVTAFDGEPYVAEPDKFSGLKFFPLDAMPDEIFVGSVDVISNYRNRVFYNGQWPRVREG